jgi:hypothetical protein
MVQILKRSVRGLQPPLCPDCKAPMNWFRSVKVADSATGVAHFFQCSGCNRIQTVTTDDDAQTDPPSSGRKPPAAAAGYYWSALHAEG